VSEALSLSCGRGSLAGEAAGDDIDSSSASCSDVSDILEDRDSGEALGEQFSAEGIGLAQPGVLEAGEVQADVEESGAAEEGADTNHRPPPAALDLPPL
jgi:hypothetical protein